MKVIPIKSILTGVPDYYAIYKRWIIHYEETGDNNSKILALHYARVAEEMGQVIIEEEDTVEITV